jgi:hypothetical protein
MLRRRRNAWLAAVLGWLLLAGCENAETKARYVKAPLEGIDLTDRISLSSAVSEARTRLASVGDGQLRADLSRDIEDIHDRALEQIAEAEREEAAELQAAREAQAAREREAAAREEERRLTAERKREEEEQKRTARRAERTEEDSSAMEPAGDQQERRLAAVERQLERAKEAVTELEVGIRGSLLNDGTKVLVLRNAKPYPVNFVMRCYARGNTAQKSFAMSMPAGGEKRVGFMQGWCGNFRGGERCEASVDDEVLWSYTVPEF